MHRRGWLVSIAFFSTLALAGSATATLSIARWTIDAGGTTQAAGGSLRLGGSIGQPDAGASSGGSLTLLSGFWLGGVSTSAVLEPDPVATLPLPFRVTAGVPSPFATATRLQLDLPEPRPVRACVHDLTGRLVRLLCARALPAGSHEIRWDGRGDDGRQLPSGVYLVRVEAGIDRETRRLVLLAR